jgi:hypothetical protein
VERSQLGQLDTPDVQERGDRDEEGIGPLAPHAFEGGIDLKAGVSVENLDLQAHRASSRFYLSQCRLGLGRTGRINEYRDTRGLGQQLAQEF